MTLGEAVLVYDILVAIAFVVDFAIWSRTSTSVVATAPLVITALATVALGYSQPTFRAVAVSPEFIAIATLVLGSAWFGYANFLAFTKRGITFSILHNHSRPAQARRPDRDFIALEDRIDEMRGHGWIAQSGQMWALTPAGQRVVRIRRALLRLLRIEAVG